MQPQIKIKRIYESASEQDGYRVLVDRLWPRGITKERANIDEWAKEITPSTPIRVAYCHIPEHWEVFKAQYEKELIQNDHLASYVDKWEEYPVITLVYAAKDEQHTHALVLQEYLEKHYSTRKG
ncbi:DUF488 family protein [Sphingobacterium sp. SRCM116780]|uniref:DUF488 domain-containing protein n=1 Tax=Sphingobacterium sp. SRCM116780 TaxID=2907623 RepID=UPI001F19F97C|nr:DUF488 family protein [Sphingobacterium sp. SRCM116780]UIR56066.1 DUF488 family protein [Sphingobacterium sp. SRCM116780]